MSSTIVSSAGAWVSGFWKYFWVYPEAHLAVYRTATAIAAAFGLLMYFDPLFALPAVAAYFLPPMYLYHVEDDPESTSIRETEESDDTDTDFDGRDTDSDGTDGDADSDGADADSNDADADADGIDIDTDSDGDDFDVDTGSDADADADGVDVHIDN